ncbi:MAG TPA: hypothetical protein PLC40_03075 [Candidatus Hydrogenedentes bacterium]|nr:hypothetical protein [Candidatus Hydrogenedentota bacterium]
MYRRMTGYIFVETVVAMGVLSLSTLVIQGALRQAILTRAQAQDYTTARFLLEQVAGEQALLFQQPEGSGSGQFPAPYEAYAYEWEIKRVDIPLPEQAASLPPEARQHFEDNFLDYMGMLRVRVTWQRGGAEFEARGETLLRPDLIWLPEGEL